METIVVSFVEGVLRLVKSDGLAQKSYSNIKLLENHLLIEKCGRHPLLTFANY